MRTARTLNGHLKRCFLFVLILFVFVAPVFAQARETEQVLVVILPSRTPLDSPAVNHWVELLKIERDRAKLTAEELPLLRLSVDNEYHLKALETLGVLPVTRVHTFICRRNSQGWPQKVLVEFPVEAPADSIVGSARNLRSVEATTVELRKIGVLIVSRPDDEESVGVFLEELGRYWLQRYGRVRPAPYPLASYNLADTATDQALRLAFPELETAGAPRVALCAFREGRPVQVLEIFDQLGTPASLVRELSASRGRFLLETASPGEADSQLSPLPSAEVRGLSESQEMFLVVSRLHETAQQLWNNIKDEDSAKNDGPRRLLLRIIEESRKFITGEAEAMLLLQESLKDFRVEPLILDPRSSLRDVQSRFQDLSKSVLEGI